MRVVVTGAAGNLGVAVARRLSAGLGNGILLRLSDADAVLSDCGADVVTGS